MNYCMHVTRLTNNTFVNRNALELLTVTQDYRNLISTCKDALCRNDVTTLVRNGEELMEAYAESVDNDFIKVADHINDFVELIGNSIIMVEGLERCDKRKAQVVLSGSPTPYGKMINKFEKKLVELRPAYIQKEVRRITLEVLRQSSGRVQANKWAADEIVRRIESNVGDIEVYALVYNYPIWKDNRDRGHAFKIASLM